MIKRRIYKVLLLFFGLFYVSTLSAQTARIVGLVIDASDEDPLIGATVYIPKLQRGEVAGCNGEFTLSGLKAGSYEMTISFMGYLKQTQKNNIARR